MRPAVLALLLVPAALGGPAMGGSRDGPWTWRADLEAVQPGAGSPTWTHLSKLVGLGKGDFAGLSLGLTAEREILPGWVGEARLAYRIHHVRGDRYHHLADARARLRFRWQALDLQIGPAAAWTWSSSRFRAGLGLEISGYEITYRIELDHGFDRFVEEDFTGRGVALGLPLWLRGEHELWGGRLGWRLAAVLREEADLANQDGDQGFDMSRYGLALTWSGPPLWASE